MEKIILIRFGEIFLKGQNRPVFEHKLRDNIKGALKDFKGISIKRVNGRFTLTNFLQTDLDIICDKLKKVFGIHSISVVTATDKDFDNVCKVSLDIFNETKAELNKENTTFKVIAKRADKTYKYNTMSLNIEIGGYILDNTSGVTVDVHNPDINVFVEIRECAYIYTKIIPCSCGMPVGCNGKAMLLISGGIDSPVAGYMTMKRGVEIEAIHFYSFPYTGELAKQKVLDLCSIIAQYSGNYKLHIVPFTRIQTEIYEKCPNNELTVLMRRFMMKIANQIALNRECNALVTGESVGQVASQTLKALGCTDECTSLPVIRPLICFDKQEIVELSFKIDTYETSILPYEDCCTVFTPKHPLTAPKLSKIEESEQLLACDELIEEAIANTESLIIFPKNSSNI